MIAARCKYKMRTVGWNAGKFIENHQSDRYADGEYKPTRKELKAMRQSEAAKYLNLHEPKVGTNIDEEA